jgi:hypothetical protein
VAKLSRVTMAFVAILLSVGAILYLAVFDVWVVPEGGSASAVLAPGDVVLVGRRSEPAKDALVRCSDPRTQVVVSGRVTALAGDRVPSNGKAAGVEPGHVVVQVTRAQAQGQEESLSVGRRRTATAPPGLRPPAPASVAAPAAPSVDAGEMLPGQTCRRVVFRLWGRDGPFSDARRFSPIY